MDFGSIAFCEYDDLTVNLIIHSLHKMIDSSTYIVVVVKIGSPMTRKQRGKWGHFPQKTTTPKHTVPSYFIILLQIIANVLWLLAFTQWSSYRSRLWRCRQRAMDWMILDIVYILYIDTNNSSNFRLRDHNEPERDCLSHFFSKYFDPTI